LSVFAAVVVPLRLRRDPTERAPDAAAAQGAQPRVGLTEHPFFDGRVRRGRRQDFLDDRQGAPRGSEFDDLLAKAGMAAQIALEVLVRFGVGVRDVGKAHIVDFAGAPTGLRRAHSKLRR
jgi:hypothetical protein